MTVYRCDNGHWDTVPYARTISVPGKCRSSTCYGIDRVAVPECLAAYLLGGAEAAEAQYAELASQRDSA